MALLGNKTANLAAPMGCTQHSGGASQGPPLSNGGFPYPVAALALESWLGLGCESSQA